jgi:hypothetical protein
MIDLLEVWFPLGVNHERELLTTPHVITTFAKRWELGNEVRVVDAASGTAL